MRVDQPAHADCDGDQRVFSVSHPGSVFRSSGTTLPDVSVDPWVSDPVVLCVGNEDANGYRSLRLRDVANLGITLADGSILCARLDPDRSIGEIACRGGAAHDVALVQNSHGAGAFDALRLETGIGSDSGPGAASLSVALGVALLPPGTSLDACRVRRYRFLDYMVMTTADATVTVEEPIQGGEVALAAHGEPFDCEHLLEENSAGILVVPFFGLDTVVGDTAHALILSD